MTVHSEATTVVFPQNNGPIIYRGVKWSVTRRVGGSFQEAFDLMDEYVDAVEAGHMSLDRACLAPVASDATDYAEHTERRANAEPAPAQPHRVDDGGTRKSMQIVGISRHTADNQITYKLYTMLSNGKEAAYPTPVVKDFDLHCLLQALEVSGRDAKAIEKNMEFGKRIPIAGMYTWVERKPIPDKPGKFYHDDNQYTFEPRV